jgi:hypothetical protein
MINNMMKTNLIILAVFCTLATTSAYAKKDHSRSGYVRKDTGTYVAPHRATNPDNRKSNNYSHKGNYNPYTGKRGTK